MGRYAKDSGGDFQDAPVGSHVAVCVRIIDLGTQHGEYQGQPTCRSQVFVSWELPNERMADGQPFIVSAFLTNSLNEKATMRGWLESWRGKPFTNEELDGFDLSAILGKPCMVNVIAKPNGGVKVGAVMALPKGSPKPTAENPPSAFWLDEFNREAFESISDGLKKIIMKSDEYVAMTSAPPPVRGVGRFEEMKDDIPF